MINVTKTFLPPQKEYQAILKRAWDTGWMTNRGVLVNELEDELKVYLGVPHLLATTNGTLPLQIAIKALGLSGEVITTPFSYVATTSSIVWEGCTPVFVDIHPEYLTIDETKIEDAITPNTSAILATHVFGNPCHVEVIDSIAKRHNLKVIYDGAHAFGVSYKGQSIFNYGDISTCSFHATKLFHTGEGGALFCSSETLLEQLFYLHNFGHHSQESFQGLGINAKMSEPQAAMGLAVLPYIPKLITDRKTIVDSYNRLIRGLDIHTITLMQQTSWNYSYFPVLFKTEIQLKKALDTLSSHDIYPRRYFYPSLNTLDYVNYKSCPISEDISKRILCLPLFPDLCLDDVNYIVDLIKAVV